MPYVAHAGIELECDATAYAKGKWYLIKSAGSVEYRWRLNKNLLYEVIAGVFSNKDDALMCAKRMYVTLLYSMLNGQIFIKNAGCNVSYEPRLYDAKKDGTISEYLQNEEFFFWDLHYTGGQLGPGVYEVEKSIEDFDEYNFLSSEIGQISSSDTDLNFDNVDEYTFTYCREAQQLLSTVVVADQIGDYGMKMTLYCGLLEHLSEDGEKSDLVKAEIDALISHVEHSGLPKADKEQIKSFLRMGKGISSRQKCYALLKHYTHRMYGKYSVNKVFDEAYSFRSTFSHGSEIDHGRIRASRYMKYVVLDVIKGYFLEKEQAHV